MEPIFSYKRSKSSMFSDIHPNTYVPMLTTIDAKTKYDQMKHNIEPGLGISFHSFPHLLTIFHNIGWECLVTFTDRHIYPSLIAEFYSHMIFNRNENDLLVNITTCIQGVDYIIDEELLITALKLQPSTSSLPKFNPYVYPLNLAVTECLNFKQNLAKATDQMIPPLLFDFPVSLGIEFLTAQSQFLARIVRQNIMPARLNNDLMPADLEIINCISNESMPYNLAYFLMTTFEHCYRKNCMGYGLLLTHIFRHLGINLLTCPTQIINNSNLVSHLHLPPKPLSVFKPPNQEDFDSHLSMSSNIEALKSMAHLMLQNQNRMIAQMEEMKQTVHNLQNTVHRLLENQQISKTHPPFHFTAGTSSTIPDLVEPLPPDDFAPLQQHFSPINFDEF